MTAPNTNLNKAMKIKNDEFYTQYEDIEREVEKYTEQLNDKIIYCNCDNYKESNFVKYFITNFENLKLKELNITYFNEKESYFVKKTKGKIHKVKLIGNGDFRSDECIQIMNNSDIIITNPPFSLFREYITLLLEYNKKFLVIGSENSISYKDLFKNIKNDKIWLGHTRPKKFFQPNGEVKLFGNICWFTNLETEKRHNYLKCDLTYSKTKHKAYSNYKAININRLKEIPYNYDGVMGVPITFVDKYNPKQFKILGSDYDVKTGELAELKKEDWLGKFDRGYVDNKRLYARIFIKRRAYNDR